MCLHLHQHSVNWWHPVQPVFRSVSVQGTSFPLIVGHGLCRPCFAAAPPNPGTLLRSVTCRSLNLSGTLPPNGWTLPPTLKELAVEGGIRGTFPQKWDLPSGLDWLSLVNTQISGSLPAIWDLPVGMSGFRLDGNPLTGPLPKLRGPLLNMTHIFINNNAISGPIPESWDLPPNLNYLDLDDNQLTGPFPSNWTLPPKLYDFFLSGNPITGTIPATWVLPRSLYRMYMVGNRKLSFPEEVWDLRTTGSPRFMFLDRNGMTGSLDRFMPAPTTYFLGLTGNNFSGELAPLMHLLPRPAVCAPPKGFELDPRLQHVVHHHTSLHTPSLGSGLPSTCRMQPRKRHRMCSH